MNECQVSSVEIAALVVIFASVKTFHGHIDNIDNFVLIAKDYKVASI